MSSQVELSMDYKPYSYSTLLKSYADETETDQTHKLEEFLSRLEEERVKIDAFKRELPLCMQLLTNGTSFNPSSSFYQRNISNTSDDDPNSIEPIKTWNVPNPKVSSIRHDENIIYTFITAHSVYSFFFFLIFQIMAFVLRSSIFFPPHSPLAFPFSYQGERRISSLLLLMSCYKYPQKNLSFDTIVFLANS